MDEGERKRMRGRGWMREGRRMMGREGEDGGSRKRIEGGEGEGMREKRVRETISSLETRNGFWSRLGGGGEKALTWLSGRGIQLIYSGGKTDTNCSAVAVRNIFSSLKGGMCVERVNT